MKLETTTIRQSAFINAKLNGVYEAFMNPKKHAEFTYCTP
jgi:hypothetical protein